MLQEKNENIADHHVQNPLNHSVINHINVSSLYKPIVDQRLYQEIQKLNLPWKQTLDRITREAKAKRKNNRRNNHQRQLEERARCLALRALRSYSFHVRRNQKDHEPHEHFQSQEQYNEEGADQQRLLLACDMTITWDQNNIEDDAKKQESDAIFELTRKNNPKKHHLRNHVTFCKPHPQQNPHQLRPQLLQKQLSALPFPSLSSSSKRTFSTKYDILLSEEERQLEERSYGKRFKLAFGVYLRLLEALDHMRNEAIQNGKEIFRTWEEERILSSLVIDSRLDTSIMYRDNSLLSTIVDGFDTINYITARVHEISPPQVELRNKSKNATADFMKDNHSDTLVVHRNIFPSTSSSDQYITRIMTLHAENQKRMQQMIQISLKGDSNLIPSADYFDLEAYDVSIPDRFDRIQSVKNFYFYNVSTEDLQLAIKIRGNIKRRGSPPKKRQKVLDLLLKSYSEGLF